MRVIVVGGGIFGVTAARAFDTHGLHTTLIDPGLPHPLAESTDISKVVRIDYGADEDYAILGEQALDGWRRWNATWPTPLFHETGVMFVAKVAMELGGFEHDSYQLLTRRGHRLERLDADAIARRFPAYRHGVYSDGYFNPEGGWAEASAVVTRLATGLDVRPGRVERVVEHGVICDGEHVAADLVVICAGSWVPLLVPELADCLHAVGQPVFHLQPADPTLFEASRFPVFGADISRTGYYGFPVNRDGIVKVANHGVGIAIAPGADQREVRTADEQALRAMLTDSFPALADAPIVHRRLCVYCDTADEHFWIARHPDRANLVVATGGSGHAFKFAPVLGQLIAAIALGESHPLAPALAAKFRWRPELALPRGTEAARHHPGDSEA